MGKKVYSKVEELSKSLKGQTLDKNSLIKEIYKSIGSDSRTIKNVLEILNKFEFVKENKNGFKFR